MRLERCFNMADLRRMARKKLPAPMFHYIDGGADDEWSLSRNSTAFDNWELLPNHLKNVENIDLSTRLLDTALALHHRGVEEYTRRLVEYADALVQPGSQRMTVLVEETATGAFHQQDAHVVRLRARMPCGNPHRNRAF